LSRGKILREILLLCAAALLALGALGGCAEDAATDTSGADTADSAGGTGSDTGSGDATVSERFTLRVALYPYVPDAGQDKYAGLLGAIEAGFEARHPDIDLRLRPLDQADDFYGVEQLTAWLTQDPSKDIVGEEGYHVVEIDGLLLASLVEAGAVSPWEGATWDTAAWHPAGLEGSRAQERLYGIPHLLCGHFVFSYDPAVTDAQDAAGLVAALVANPSPAPNLTGNFLGSWNLPALYLDGLLDTYTPAEMASAFGAPPDAAVAGSMAQVVAQCVELSGKNPCIDGTFDDDYEDAALRFAQGRADATFGYSERLYALLRNGADAEAIEMTSFPLGEGKRPAVFIDTLVKRADCVGACEDAASRFAAYLIEPAVVADLLLAKDAGAGAIPRYLIPAQDAVYAQPGVEGDRHFQRLRVEMADAVVFPDERFPSERKALRDALLEVLAPAP
jgi:thiamine pyridinylase